MLIDAEQMPTVEKRATWLVKTSTDHFDTQRETQCSLC